MIDKKLECWMLIIPLEISQRLYRGRASPKPRNMILLARHDLGRIRRWYALTKFTVMTNDVQLGDLSFPDEDPSDTRHAVIKQALVDMHMRRSTVELILGKSDNVVAYMVEAQKIPMKRVYLDFYDQVKRLRERKEWDVIMVSDSRSLSLPPFFLLIFYERWGERPLESSW